MKPAIHQLRELFAYEPETGRLFWREARGNRAAGSRAGTVNDDGHRQVRIDGTIIYEHHIVWALEKGYWPALIDHRDNQRDNNRIGNLREATSVQNRQNQLGRPRANGLPHGVYKAHGGRFRACIGFDGRTLHIGVYDTPDTALDARIIRERELFGEFARQR